jgi:hypothetical protein
MTRAALIFAFVGGVVGVSGQGPNGAPAATFEIPSVRRRRTRMRSCRPSSRYRRRTRFFFTGHPSRRSSAQIRVNPNRGRACAKSRMRDRSAVWSARVDRRYQAARLNCAR